MSASEHPQHSSPTHPSPHPSYPTLVPCGIGRVTNVNVKRVMSDPVRGDWGMGAGKQWGVVWGDWV